MPFYTVRDTNRGISSRCFDLLTAEHGRHWLWLHCWSLRELLGSCRTVFKGQVCKSWLHGCCPLTLFSDMTQKISGWIRSFAHILFFPNVTNEDFWGCLLELFISSYYNAILITSQGCARVICAPPQKTKKQTQGRFSGNLISYVWESSWRLFYVLLFWLLDSALLLCWAACGLVHAG